jgi:hypothetical protein
VKPSNRFGQALLALALGGLGSAFAPAASAAAFVDFSSSVDAIVEIIDIDGGPTIPSGVAISYGNAVTSNEASWTSLLSFASSDPFLYPDSSFESMSGLDVVENDHLNQGQVGADQYGTSGNAYTATASEGFLEIFNDTGAAIDVLINVYLDMTAEVTPSTGLQAFSTVDGFAYASVLLYDDALTSQVDIDQELSASLTQAATPFSLDQDYTYTIEDGDYLTFAMYVNTNAGGTAVGAAVPVPATLALMALGLLGVRGFRARRA